MPSSDSDSNHHHHHHHHKKKDKHKHKHKHSKSPHRHQKKGPNRRDRSQSSRSSRENSEERNRDKNREKDREPKPIPSPPIEPVPEPNPPSPEPNPDPLPPPSPDPGNSNGPHVGPDPESDPENTNNDNNNNAEDSAKSLNKAVRGLGTDEKRIINELTRNSNNQIQKIKEIYFVMYGKELKQDLKSDLSFRFREVCLSLLEPKIEYEAIKLNSAIKGIGTDEQCIIDILCTKNAFEIKELKEAYKKRNNSDLENDLVNEETGPLGNLFRSLATGARQESDIVDKDLAHKEAQDIYNAGEGRLGTNESKICEILALRSFEQLNETFKEYFKIYGVDILEAIESETSGKFKKALIAIVQSVRNASSYFAKRIHDSIKGIGTKDDDLIRIIVSRSEIDMNEIRNEYKRLFNEDLCASMSKDLSGDYKKIMLKLVEK